jgi:hypothetical protein
MFLPLPNLDDRRWADLVEEGQALIPLYAPEWTDHNAHDPGITLMELFAWIAEMDIYQLNRIPARHRRKFLALVGILAAPPQPSRTVLGFTLKEPNQTSLVIPATLEFAGEDPFGQTTPFRTLREIQVVPGELAGIRCQDQKGSQDLTSLYQQGKPVALFGKDPQPGAALYLGFTKPLPPGAQASLYFTLSDWWPAQQEKDRLLEEIQVKRESCRPLKSCWCPEGQATAGIGENGSSTDSGHAPLEHHSVRTSWEFLAGPDHWKILEPTLGQIEDHTRSFTLNGHLFVKLPESMAADPKDERYYLRCRLVAGAYDAAPTLQKLTVNGVLAEQAAPAGRLKWTIAADSLVEGGEPECGKPVGLRMQFNEQGEIAFLHFHDETAPQFLVLEYEKSTQEVPGRLSLEAELLGRGSGRPRQELILAEKPVQESSFQLFTFEQNLWHAWRLRNDFDASGGNDFHFLLDATPGTVTFGDGERGRVVPPEALIVASYRATRAESGNLDPWRINRLAKSSHNLALLSGPDALNGKSVEIANPLPTTGGAAAETLAHAQGRALELLDHQADRAVTLDDCEFLAQKTPGVRLARVKARANFHPAFPCLDARGITTVIILPYLPADRPMPSLGLKRAVAACLNRHRLIGTRLEVAGPAYVKVAVQTQVKAWEGLNRTTLRKNINDRLNRFFHPLAGGPDGRGWPFGRDVYRSEVFKIIGETPGVEYILGLDLVPASGVPQCGNLCLGPTGLVQAGEHQIEVN